MAKVSSPKKTIICPKCNSAGSITGKCPACKGTGKITLKMILKKRQELTLRAPHFPVDKLIKPN